MYTFPSYTANSLEAVSYFLQPWKLGLDASLERDFVTETIHATEQNYNSYKNLSGLFLEESGNGDLTLTEDGVEFVENDDWDAQGLIDSFHNSGSGTITYPKQGRPRSVAAAFPLNEKQRRIILRAVLTRKDSLVSAMIRQLMRLANILYGSWLPRNGEYCGASGHDNSAHDVVMDCKDCYPEITSERLGLYFQLFPTVSGSTQVGTIEKIGHPARKICEDLGLINTRLTNGMGKKMTEHYVGKFTEVGSRIYQLLEAKEYLRQEQSELENPMFVLNPFTNEEIPFDDEVEFLVRSIK